MEGGFGAVVLDGATAAGEAAFEAGGVLEGAFLAEEAAFLAGTFALLVQDGLEFPVGDESASAFFVLGFALRDDLRFAAVADESSACFATLRVDLRLDD